MAIYHHQLVSKNLTKFHLVRNATMKKGLRTWGRVDSQGNTIQYYTDSLLLVKATSPHSKLLHAINLLHVRQTIGLVFSCLSKSVLQTRYMVLFFRLGHWYKQKVSDFPTYQYERFGSYRDQFIIFLVQFLGNWVSRVKVDSVKLESV